MRFQELLQAECFSIYNIKIRHLKGVFPTLIHIHAQNNVMRYAFEGHKNVGWGPHPVLGPPAGQPWSILIPIDCEIRKLLKAAQS